MSPDHPYAGAPPYAMEFDQLALAAEIERDRRRRMYPDLVAAEKVSAETAAADTEAWEAIAADWQRVVTLSRPEAPDAHNSVKLAAIETALSRASRAAARPAAGQAEHDRVIALTALLWHQRQLTYRGRTWSRPMVQFVTGCNEAVGRVFFMGA